MADLGLDELSSAELRIQLRRDALGGRASSCLSPERRLAGEPAAPGSRAGRLSGGRAGYRFETARAVVDSIIEEAVATASAVDGVQAVGEVRARWVGHRLHAEANITVDRDVDVATGHRIAAAVRDELLEQVLVLGDVIVHVDPCDHNLMGPRAAPGSSGT